MVALPSGLFGSRMRLYLSPMLRRPRTTVAVLAIFGALALAAGGIADGSALAQLRAPHVAPHAAVARPATAAATAKFLLHAGITYYVFNHYIWKPYKAGDLHGFRHVAKIVEAGIAAVFIYHEAKLMIADVKQSKLLSFLATPITAVVTKMSTLKAAIKGGNFGTVSSVNNQLGSIQSQAGAKGVAIKQIAHGL